MLLFPTNVLDAMMCSVFDIVLEVGSTKVKPVVEILLLSANADDGVNIT